MLSINGCRIIMLQVMNRNFIMVYKLWSRVHASV